MANIIGIDAPVLNDQDYVDKIIDSFAATDGHDHSTGKGLPITAAGITPGTITNTEISASAAIARTKIANGTASHVVINDGSGTLSSEATLAKSRGGSGQDNSSLTFPSTGTLATDPLTTKGDIIARSSTVPARLAVGSDNTFLKADSSQALGVAWSSVANNISVLAKTGNYTLLTTDDLVTGDSSGGTFTFTLPTAVGNTGKILRMMKIDSSVTAIAIATTSSQTINGITTNSINTQYEMIAVISNGSNWFITERRYPSAWVDYSGSGGGVVGATTSAPTFGTLVRNEWMWRRVGDSAEIMFNKAHSTGGSAGTGTYLFPLPTGFTIDTAKNSGAFLDGQGLIGNATFNGGAAVYAGPVLIKDTSNLYLQLGADGSPYASMSSTDFTAATTTWRLSFMAKVPITGWKG